MDCSKFSKESFEKIKKDKSKVKKLLRELDKSVAQELREIIGLKMEEIVNELNSQGHSLKRNARDEEFNETDFCESHGARTCGFRLGTDLIVSSGYYGASDCEEVE